MIGFLGFLIVLLAIVTIGLVTAGFALGVHGLSLYRQGLAVRDEVLPRVADTRQHVTGLAAATMHIKQTLLDEWARLRPRVEHLELESTRTVALWKRSSEQAGDVARKTRSDLSVVRAAL